MNASRLADKITIVLLTYNCGHRIEQTLKHLANLPDKPYIIAVDNASKDDTVKRLKMHDIFTISLKQNIGAAARNIGVRAAKTPYIAFCDDDTFWQDGAIEKIVRYFDTYPRLTAINARILVGKYNKLDPICQEMADSPLESKDLPGAKIVGFLGGAVAMRRKEYLEAGGYEKRLFLGGEEELLATDLITNGGEIRYLPDVITHHHPSRENFQKLRSYGVRNTLWFVWRRRSLSNAWVWTKHIAKQSDFVTFIKGFSGFMRELPWVVKTRKPVSHEFEQELELVDLQRLNASTRTYGKIR